ncbi:MAG TPA: pyrroline-5-carboxylate reductase, partial [Acidimicrobiaceae bacterium]|nr:pyrroline-5-carboxylate reductase [Acidimicrobiaceae bacterium]
MDRAALQIVGGGKMGEALLAGLLRSDPDLAVRVVETHGPRAEELRAAHPSLEVADVPGPAEGTLIAVKPHLVADVAAAVGAADGGRVLSIAAGVTIAALEAALPEGARVVRAMPNTPALVGAGAAAIAAGAN